MSDEPRLRLRCDAASRGPGQDACARERGSNGPRWAPRMRLLAFLLIGLTLFPFPAEAQREKLSLGYDTLAPSKAELWVGKEAGIFERNGLDVELHYLEGGSRGIQGLLSGSIAILSGGGLPGSAQHPRWLRHRSDRWLGQHLSLPPPHGQGDHQSGAAQGEEAWD